MGNKITLLTSALSFNSVLLIEIAQNKTPDDIIKKVGSLILIAMDSKALDWTTLRRSMRKENFIEKFMVCATQKLTKEKQEKIKNEIKKHGITVELVEKK